ncbi:MAG: T9SS type A sorting domain-containing protein [Bacteroidales bacterium]|jgi:hypothetical protein|nr:T9SS type A sorting domain-containing protein [Bacteroidales bacterium]
MKKLIVPLLSLLLLCLTGTAYSQKSMNVTIQKELTPTVRINPFLEQQSGVKFTPHPTLPYIYTAEPVEDKDVIKKASTKGSGCDAAVTYVGHDNQWAVVQKDYLPQTYQFYGTVSNNGETVLENVRLKATVYNSLDVEVFTATSDPVASLPLGESRNITITTAYTLSTQDNYYIVYEVMHDCNEPISNLADNERYGWIQVSDDAMARFTDNTPVNSSNFLMGADGVVGSIITMDRTDTLTAISYKTYSASAATTAKAAVYEVETMDTIHVTDVGYWEGETWVHTGWDTTFYVGIKNYQLVAKSDDGITYAYETANNYYLPIDRMATGDQNYRGALLEQGKKYLIGSQGPNVSIANMAEVNTGNVYVKVEDSVKFSVQRYAAITMGRMHFGDVTPLTNVDAGVKELVEPTTTYAIPKMFRPRVSVKNYGKQEIPAGLNVYLQYDTNVITTVTTEAIAPLATITVTFQEMLRINEPQKIIFKAWTALSGDQYVANDTLTSETDLVNPALSWNFELPTWNFYSWNATASRNRFSPWKTVDEDYAAVKSLFINNNYNVMFTSMGASFGGGNVGNSGRRSFQGITPSLTSPSLMPVVQPHNGKKIGFVASPQGQASDWMISSKVRLNTNSSVELWAMSLNGDDNVEKFQVLVSTTNDSLQNFIVVSGDTALEIPRSWTYFSYDLSQYDNSHIFVAIKYVSNNQLFAAFDDILIKTDFVDNADLSVTSASSPVIILDTALTVQFQNNGLNTIGGDVSFSYKLDNDTVVTVPYTNFPIEGNAVRTFSFPRWTSLAAGAHTFKVWANFADDYDHSNDTLVYKVDINPLASPFHLTFEEFVDFSENFYPWVNLDGDKSLSYNLGTIDESMTYFKEWMPLGFIAFNPSATIPASTNRFPVYEGQKFGASIGVWDPKKQNDDWLISPQFRPTGDFNYVKMAVRSSSSDLEKYRILVSTTTNDTASFVPLTDVLDAPTTWTEIAYPLNNYIGQDIHIAVQCVTYDGHVFMLDDLNIVINENARTAAAVSAVLSPAAPLSLPFTEIPVKVEISNVGNQTVTPATVSMKLDDGAVVTETYTGTAIAWREKTEFTFDTKIDVATPGVHVLKVWTDGGDTLTYEIYINEEQDSWLMDFDAAYDFTKVLSPWTNIDRDGVDGLTFNLNLTEGSFELVYPGAGTPQSLEVFNPSSVNIEPLIKYMPARSGNRMGIFVAPATAGVAADDWFISPKLQLLQGSSSISFYARTLAQGLTEKYNVLVSTTDLELSSFTPVGNTRTVTVARWDTVGQRIDLSAYASQEVYVAIQYVSDRNTGAMMLVDDIEITTSEFNANEKLTNSAFSVTPNPTKGTVHIQASDIVRDVTVFDILGKPVMRVSVNSSSKEISLSNLKSGIYFIQLNTQRNGTVVKKVVKE